VNNIFNLAYEVLQWKVHRAILGAKLEPYLGFVHSEQHGKPSLRARGWVEIPRIKYGRRQTLGTLINEEALLLAKYLRDEIDAWKPRISAYAQFLVKV